MRKNSIFLIALFAFPLFVACEKDNSIQKSNLVGEWYNNFGNFYEETLTINSDGKFIHFTTFFGLNGSEKYMSSQNVFEGSLKLKMRVIIAMRLKMRKSVFSKTVRRC